MCGIAGFTNFTGKVRDPSEVLSRMTSLLASRGPDGQGQCSDSDIWLGHRRLSIIDIQGGAQPMSTENGRYHITYNGEIYNYIELRKALEAKGHRFTTESDTEVLLAQFAEDGVNALTKFNGMFAFALWDKKDKRLLLARDRIGIKPLHYAWNHKELIFASEIKALLVHPAIDKHIDSLSLSKFLTYSFIPAPHTIFEGICKLEPGHYAVLENGRFTKSCYWDIPLRDNPVNVLDVEDASAYVRELLEDSVKRRLRSDVPVGVFLSGGIDSSAITALAARNVSGKLSTFSIGFEEASYDESSYAQQVASACDTDHHHEVMSMSRAIDLLPTVMGILDEPFGDASILPTYLLSAYTAKSVKVVLGGDGGDELFAGYASFPAHRIMEMISFLPCGWRDALVRLARRLPVSHRYASVNFLLRQFFKGAGVSPEIRFFLWMGAFGNHDRNAILSKDVRDVIARENPYEDITRYVGQSGLTSHFERLLYLCTKLYFQDDILVKVDRASMANSLEVRVPFMDHKLVEAVSGMHSSYKLRGLTTKYLLKRSVKDLLPANIIRRRKAGFSVPVAQWIEKDLRVMIEDLCSDSALKEDGLFDPVAIRRMLDDHYARRCDYRKEIWTLFSFLSWRENYYR